MSVSNKNNGNIKRAIGTNTSLWKLPTEGTDANGRDAQIIKDEIPTRIDIVNDGLVYIGWAEFDTPEGDKAWKIRRVRLVGSVWYQEYAYGNQYFRYKWTSRASLPYA